METPLAKNCLRILLFLDQGKQAVIIPFDDGTSSKCFLERHEGKKKEGMAKPSRSKILILIDDLESLRRAALITDTKGTCALSVLGIKRLKRIKAVKCGAEDKGFLAQHRSESEKTIMIKGAKHRVRVNDNESPLSQLKKRKTKNGVPWLSEEGFAAGERLRHDFSRSHMMQSVTANWDPTSSLKSNKGGAGGKVDMSDATLDARTRMYAALDYVGADLAGVLTDVCCYLKGLECVERERCWPPRSGKVMVRVGLELLARYYGFTKRTSVSP